MKTLFTLTFFILASCGGGSPSNTDGEDHDNDAPVIVDNDGPNDNGDGTSDPNPEAPQSTIPLLDTVTLDETIMQ